MVRKHSDSISARFTFCIIVYSMRKCNQHLAVCMGKGKLAGENGCKRIKAVLKLFFGRLWSWDGSIQDSNAILKLKTLSLGTER